MPEQSGLLKSPNIIAKLPRQYSSVLLQNAKTLVLSEGSTLFQKGAPGDGCYWVQSGVLKVIVSSQRGEELILAVLGAGDLAAMAGVARESVSRALAEWRRRHVIASARTHYLIINTTVLQREVDHGD